jgi:hypothetical protein
MQHIKILNSHNFFQDHPFFIFIISLCLAHRGRPPEKVKNQPYSKKVVFYTHKQFAKFQLLCKWNLVKDIGLFRDFLPPLYT